MSARLEQNPVQDTTDCREMKILWIKIGGLWPANTGGRIRSFKILSELSRRHRVTLLTTHSAGENPEELRRQLPYCEHIKSYPHSAPKVRSQGFLLALIRSWFSRLPVDLWKSQVTELKNEAAYLLEKEKYDICIADFLVAIPNLPLHSRVPTVFFAHNVEYMIWKRLCDNETSLIRRVLLGIEWRKFKRFEEAACRQTDLTIAVSPEDRDLLVVNSPETNRCAISTGVDINYFRPMGKKEIPEELVFTGSMDWHPNEDAMLYFMESILPLIRRDCPKASVTVVGRNPGLRLSRQALRSRVNVTGTVNDIRSFMDVAAVYIVPLRIGGGTRLKIFEALAMGKAVVSTTIGAEGLPLEHNKHFVCADDPVDFSNAVVSLLNDPERRHRLGAAGRQLVTANYSWEQVSREFEKNCGKIVA